MSSPLKMPPEFFKMYLPELSRNRMRIPTVFVKHFNGAFPERAILRDSVGRVWPVEVGQIGKDMYFLKGWQKLLIDNLVEEGDFFVFQYGGSYIFDFKLFGKTGCQKKDSREVNVDAYRKSFFLKEDIEEVERDEEEEEEEEKEKEEEKKGGEEEDDDDDDDEEEVERDEEEVEEEEKEKEEKKGGEEDDDDDEEEEEGGDDDKEEEYSGRGPQPIGFSGLGGHKQTAIEKTIIAYKERACTKSQYKKACTGKVKLDSSLDFQSIVKPKNPYFVAKIQPGRRSKVAVPLDLLRDHKIELPPTITLRDPLGRSWIAPVVVWKDGRIWIRWKPFYKWNHVGDNDTCICEFTRESSHQEYLIVIHILRAQPKPK